MKNQENILIQLPEKTEEKAIEKITPDSNEIVLKVNGLIICKEQSEVRYYSCPSFLWFPSRITISCGEKDNYYLSQRLIGQIESIGENVTLYEKGDQILTHPTNTKTISPVRRYMSLTEESIISVIPNNIDSGTDSPYAHTGLNILYYLISSIMRYGQNILIFGASGRVGTSAVKLARHLGVTVTGVSSQEDFKLLSSLGVNKIIDYHCEAFGNDLYDIIFDSAGEISYSYCQKALKPNGRFVSVM